MNDRLYRSVDDRVISGVCGGLAFRMGIDPSLVRIVYAIGTLLTGIFPLLILYVIMAAVVPEEPTGFAGTGRPPAAPGPDAVPGWAAPSPAAGWPSTGDPAPWTTPTGTTPWPPAGLPAATDPAGGPVTLADPDAGGGAPGDPVSGQQPPPQPGWSAAPTWSRAARRERRRSDPLLGVIGGVALVGLGIYFLVRDRITIDWGIVWAAALVAVGVVVIVAAFVRPRR